MRTNYLYLRLTNFLFQFDAWPDPAIDQVGLVLCIHSWVLACLFFVSSRSRSKFWGRLGGCMSPTLSGGGSDEFGMVVEGVTSVV